MTIRYTDQAVAFGPQSSLVGILTRPVGPEQRDRPAIVILNTGILHRVGHHRMYVVLSRMLAKAGHTVLRFDLAGLGDSDTRSGGLAPLDAALADIRDAVDWLAEGQLDDRVILMGLCSGADHAVIYSRSDPRIVGLVLVDPSLPRTPKYYVVLASRFIIRAMASPAVWHWLKRRLAGSKEESIRSMSPAVTNQEVRNYLEGAYRESVARGVQFLAMFTTGAWGRPIARPYEHNYRNQLLDAFPDIPFEGQVQLEFFRGADHVFTSEGDRKRLFKITCDWAQRTIYQKAPVISRCCAKVAMPYIAVASALCLT